ncbi:MAG: hypothetical protein HND47_21440 [Chloroflexi bacterium]|nr:hypothetical protein [Chloroflexota bacterium]
MLIAGDEDGLNVRGEAQDVLILDQLRRERSSQQAVGFGFRLRFDQRASASPFAAITAASA